MLKNTGGKNNYKYLDFTWQTGHSVQLRLRSISSMCSVMVHSVPLWSIRFQFGLCYFILLLSVQFDLRSDSDHLVTGPVQIIQLVCFARSTNIQ